jgi:hypothetical protein
MDVRCDTCRFGWQANPATIQCRRHAPPAVPAGQKIDLPALPLDFWCGEHEPKGPPTARATRKGQH